MTKYWLLKDEYLIILLHDNCCLLYTLLLPILSIFIIYYVIPYIDEIIYDKHLENKYKKVDIKLKKEKERVIEKGDILKQKEKNIEKEEEIIAKEEKLQKTQEELEHEKREKDYKEIKKNSKFNETIEDIKKCVYKLSWQIYKDYWNGSENIEDRRMKVENIVFADSNELIIKDWLNIILTKKGKYILKLHENESNT